VDRLEAHARATGMTAEDRDRLLDLLTRSDHLAVGALARMLWIPPGLASPAAGPQRLLLAPGEHPARAALPSWAWDACEPFDVFYGRWLSPLVAAARDLALSFAGDPQLVRAAEIWDSIRDVDTADRRDPAHRDPSVGDRIERSLRPQSYLDGVLPPPVRRPPWSVPQTLKDRGVR
jgi:hypothetical protein